MKNFTIQASRKFLVAIHQSFKAGLQARDIYPELKKYFCKKNSNVTWGECYIDSDQKST